MFKSVPPSSTKRDVSLAVIMPFATAVMTTEDTGAPLSRKDDTTSIVFRGGPRKKSDYNLCLEEGVVKI